jgi:ABC-type proline/glycine betaine transport system ATPase subunit
MFLRLCDIADRILFMDGGVIVEEGKPDQLLFAPRTERVGAFLKRYNGRLSDLKPGSARVTPPIPQARFSARTPRRTLRGLHNETIR